MRFDARAALTACRENAERLIAMVSGTPDVDVRVGPEWTVSDVFAHVATVAPRYLEGPRGRLEVTRDVAELPAYNDRALADLDTRDVGELGVRLRGTLDELEAVLPRLVADPGRWTFHGGCEVDSDVALGILLGELVVHGWDIATALGRPWPITADQVELIQQGLDPILPGWLDASARGHNGTYEVRIRGGGRHRFAFHEGVLRTGELPARAPDVVLSADPATYLLVVYKRRSQWPGIATGRLVAWGCRPWLAFTFTSLFQRP